ncbi:2516_t:CDS:2 [Dentiscutata erythropus]|uniref:2516_t:CDS:1 n=1 Tax=Dentiscutata erythropus TaxID=1348616 RepID=A0A9N9JLD8_9GLOM|nr:2516_t:CDS:2 [Dentiscutata erythropus]
MEGWDPQDDPFEEHVNHSPDCAWAICYCSMRNFNDNKLPFSWDDKDKLPTSKNMEEARIKTFGTWWPHDGKKGWVGTIKKMAKAGFIYSPTIGSLDNVTCQYCGVGLEGWEQKDDPTKEHNKRFPLCPFFVKPPSKPKNTKTKKSKATTKAGTTKRTRKQIASKVKDVKIKEEEVINNNCANVDDNSGHEIVVPYTNTSESSVQVDPIVTESVKEVTEPLHEQLEEIPMVEDRYENLMEEQNRKSCDFIQKREQVNSEVINNNCVNIDDNNDDSGREIVIPYVSTSVSSVQAEPIATESAKEITEPLHEKTQIVEHCENSMEEQNRESHCSIQEHEQVKSELINNNCADVDDNNRRETVISYTSAPVSLVQAEPTTTESVNEIIESLRVQLENTQIVENSSEEQDRKSYCFIQNHEQVNSEFINNSCADVDDNSRRETVIPYTSAFVSSVQSEPTITESAKEITEPLHEKSEETPMIEDHYEKYEQINSDNNCADADDNSGLELVIPYTSAPVSLVQTEPTITESTKEFTESLCERFEKTPIFEYNFENLMEEQNRKSYFFIQKHEQINSELINNNYADVDDNSRHIVVPYTSAFISSVQTEPTITESTKEITEPLYERLEKTPIFDYHFENLMEQNRKSYCFIHKYEHNNCVDVDNNSRRDIVIPHTSVPIFSVPITTESTSEVTRSWFEKTPIVEDHENLMEDQLAKTLTVENYLKDLTEQQERILAEKTNQLLDAILEIKRRAKNAIMTIPVK